MFHGGSNNPFGDAVMIGIISGTALTIYCMVRSYQSFRRSGDTKESRVVSAIVAMLFALIGTYAASCVLMEIL